MLTLKPLPEFTEWLDGLADAAVRGLVVARMKRLERGLMGDVEPVGEGVSELRIHVGAGWRVYFVQRGAQVIVLLRGLLAHSEGRHKARQVIGCAVGMTKGHP